MSSSTPWPWQRAGWPDLIHDAGAIADEVLSTAAIEGELLPRDSVRSSVMRRLGIDAPGDAPRGVDGADKYTKLTGVSKPTATRDLSDRVSKQQLRTHGIGKATRYDVQVPDWKHGPGDTGDGR